MATLISFFRHSTTETVLRDTCWICGKRITPNKAPRALCASCATGGGLGPYT